MEKNMNENENTSVEVLPAESLAGSSAVALERAQIDMQVATAHRYPRSMSAFKRGAMEMVILDEETAQSCIYRRPVGKKYNAKTKKTEIEYAEGKSIRMAEIVASNFGNLVVGAQIIEMTPRYVKARGFAHDLEKNYAVSADVLESTVTSSGEPYSERMRLVVAKAALSKARRDATFQVVPSALCRSLEDAARKTAIGTEATLDQRRKNVGDWIRKLAIDGARVFEAIGIKGLDDLGLGELEVLTGIRTALKDGDITLDEAFPAPAPEQDGRASKQATDTLKAKASTSPPAAVKPQAAVKPSNVAFMVTANEANAFLAEIKANPRMFREWMIFLAVVKPTEDWLCERAQSWWADAIADKDGTETRFSQWTAESGTLKA